LSKGIKTSINHKRELYLSSRNSNNPKLKEYYKLYCKRLSKVIREAKILHYKKQILTSQNKTRTTWNIVRSETGGKKKTEKEDITSLNINGMLIQNQQTIANFLITTLQQLQRNKFIQTCFKKISLFTLILFSRGVF